MKISFIISALVAVFFSVNQSKATPPSPFIDTGACPFECCKYREWVAKKDIQLKDKVDGQIVVGKIISGEKVKALTGEVHTIPNVVETLRDHGKFKKGDLFYLLTYQGEGLYKVWFKDSIGSEEILFLEFTKQYDFKNCDPSKLDCWGKIKNPKRESTWWVKLEKSDGKTGWTSQSKEFLGQDSCS